MDDVTYIETHGGLDDLRGQESADYDGIADGLLAESVTGEAAERFIADAAATATRGKLALGSFPSSVYPECVALDTYPYVLWCDRPYPLNRVMGPRELEQASTALDPRDGRSLNAAIRGSSGKARAAAGSDPVPAGRL